MDLREEIQELIAVSYIVNKLVDDVVKLEEITESLVIENRQTFRTPIIIAGDSAFNPRLPPVDPKIKASQQFDNSHLICETYIVKPDDLQSFNECQHSPSNSLEEFQRLEEQIAHCVDNNRIPPSSVWSKSWHEGGGNSSQTSSPFTPISIHNPWSSSNNLNSSAIPFQVSSPQSSFQPVSPSRRLPHKIEDDPSRRKRSPSGGAKTILAHLEEEKLSWNNQINELKQQNEQLLETLRKKTADCERLKWQFQHANQGSRDKFLFEQLKEENRKLASRIGERDEKAALKEKEIERLITEQDILLVRITDLLKHTEVNSNFQKGKIQEMQLKLEISESMNDELKIELTSKESKIKQQEEEHQTLLNMHSELVSKVGEVVQHSETSTSSHNEEIKSLGHELSLTKIRCDELTRMMTNQKNQMDSKDEEIKNYLDFIDKLRQSSVNKSEAQTQLANKDKIIQEHEEEKQKHRAMQMELLAKIGDLVKTNEQTSVSHDQKIDEITMKLQETQKLLEITKKTLNEKEFVIEQKEEEKKKLTATQTELLLQLGELIRKSEVCTMNEEETKTKLLEANGQVDNLKDKNICLQKEIDDKCKETDEVIRNQKEKEMELGTKIQDLVADNISCTRNSNELQSKVQELTEELKDKNEKIQKLKISLQSIKNDVPTGCELSVVRSYVHPEILKRTTILVREAFELKQLVGDEAARYMSNGMDSLFGEHWQVVLYRQDGHGCFVYHNNNCFICFQLGSYHLVLFKY